MTREERIEKKMDRLLRVSIVILATSIWSFVMLGTMILTK